MAYQDERGRGPCTHMLTLWFPSAQGAVWSCVLNEEAVVAATASADFSTRLWNALTGDEVHQFQHSHIARTVAFARRSPRLLSAGAAAQLVSRSPGGLRWF